MRKTRAHRSNRIATHPSTSILTITFLTFLFALGARACPGNSIPDEFSEKIIGIHLGRTESRVGSAKDGGIVVFPGEEGGHEHGKIRSVVKLTEGGVLVAGEGAKSAGGPDLFSAVLGISGYFPTSEDGDPSTKPPPRGIEYVLNNKNHTEVQVTINDTKHTISPPDIYASLLMSLRSIAERTIGPDITGAVISLPRGASDKERSYIDYAGDLIGLPIIRQQNETTSTILALGLDEESYDSDRYALVFDLDMDADELHLSIIEMDMGVMDTIASHSVEGIGENLEDDEYVDMMLAQAASLDRDEDAPAEQDILAMAEAIGSVDDLVNADLAISARKALDELFVTAPIAINELTDLLFMGDSALYTKMQDSIEDYITQVQVQTRSADGDGTSTSTSERQLNVANSPTLSSAPIWGAALSAYRMMAVDWVPCCCSTRRPPIGVAVAGGEFVEVIPGCQDVPLLSSNVLEGKCDDSGQTAIKVVMRDVPSLDYHAQFELGDAYVANDTITDILLAEFDLPTAACKVDSPVMIEIEMFLSRQMELIMRATDQKTNEAQLLTIPYLDSECGAEDRDAPRKYSLEIDSGVPEYLEARYQRDLRGFVGGGHGQKKVLARREE
ncbi:Hsp70 protein-domain-containing protein [Aspergillus keveii]|uniref:Hsp70 protein-domain-containing protein n=1 Tax=Aspergillus keveii TaxID=714993 RepID=A0ABR4FMB5_9EURO